MSTAVPSLLSLPSLNHLPRPQQLQRPRRKWPFPPAQQPVAAPRSPSRSQPQPQLKPIQLQAVSRRQMMCDVLMVAAWGALIPGLMWLGAAVGF